MNKARILMIAGVILCSLAGCDIETNHQRATVAKEKTVLRRLLVSLELFRQKNGSLPDTLEVLGKNDAQIRDINPSAYTFSPTGIVVGDGSTWLIAATNILKDSNVTVGRLPVEVARRVPAKQRL